MYFIYPFFIFIFFLNKTEKLSVSKQIQCNSNERFLMDNQSNVARLITNRLDLLK